MVALNCQLDNLSLVVGIWRWYFLSYLLSLDLTVLLYMGGIFNVTRKTEQNDNCHLQLAIIRTHVTFDTFNCSKQTAYFASHE